MSAQPPQPPPERYRLAMYGGGTEDVDRMELRNRIRKGEVDARTHIARAGTDEWLPTSSFPELTRYLELAEEKRRVVSTAAAAPRAHSIAVTTMTEEMIEALTLPLKGSGIVTIAAIAAFLSIPLIGLLSVPITTVYVVAIVRHSANGNREMPPWVETDDVVGNLLLWLKTWLVTLIAMWPVLSWVLIWSASTYRYSPEAFTVLFGGIVAAGAVSMLYFPACLATIAVWDSVLDSLNPVYVFAVIKRIGWDYVTVVLTYVLAMAVAIGISIAFDAVLRSFPFVGKIPGRMVVIWAQFYTAHLLGWAVFRHSDELGWD